MSINYEEFRLKQIAANRAKLLQLGLTPSKSYAISAPPPVRVVAPPTPKSSPVPKVERPRVEGTRTSSRVKSLALGQSGKPGKSVETISLLDDDDEEERRIVREERQGELASRLDRSLPRPNPKRFGMIPGTPVGTWAAGRMEFSQRGVHAPVVAGIAGGDGGCWSVALSGGYPEDCDLGYSFTYTGSGGRDLKGSKASPKNLRTAPQTFDQSWTALNLALKRSSETGKPVRVIRGFKCKSPFAPLTGYRFDGLYQVKSAWMDVGATGFNVCRYAFARLPGQPPLHIQKGREEEAAQLVADVDVAQAQLIRTGARKGSITTEVETIDLSDEEEDEQVAAGLVPNYAPPTPASSDNGSAISQESPTRKRKAAEPGRESTQVRAKVARVVKPVKVVAQGTRRSTRVKA